MLIFFFLHSTKEWCRLEKNRSIVDMVSCMLGELTKYLWIEEVNIIIYILKKFPTKAIDGKSSYEV